MADKKYLDEDGLAVVATKVNEKLKVVSTMPVTPTNGQVVLYVGTTTTDYTQGGIYLYNGTAWQLISTADVDLTPYKTTFNGSHAEWSALTLEQKAMYDIVNFTDDEAIGLTITISDVVQDGNMNPVTSNAVFDALQSTIIDVTHDFQGVSGDWTAVWSTFLPAGKWAYSIIGNSSSKSAVVGMLATPAGWMDIPCSNPVLDYTSLSVQICTGVIDAGTTGRTISFQYYCGKSPADTLTIRVLAVKVGE